MSTLGFSAQRSIKVNSECVTFGRLLENHYRDFVHPFDNHHYRELGNDLFLKVMVEVLDDQGRVPFYRKEHFESMEENLEWGATILNFFEINVTFILIRGAGNTFVDQKTYKKKFYPMVDDRDFLANTRFDDHLEICRFYDELMIQYLCHESVQVKAYDSVYEYRLQLDQMVGRTNLGITAKKGINTVMHQIYSPKSQPFSPVRRDSKMDFTGYSDLPLMEVFNKAVKSFLSQQPHVVICDNREIIDKVEYPTKVIFKDYQTNYGGIYTYIAINDDRVIVRGSFEVVGKLNYDEPKKKKFLDFFRRG